MANEITLPRDKELAKQVIENQNELDRIKTERGWLGGIWGVPTNIPNNIAAFSIVLLLITGIGYTFLNYDKKPETLNLSIKDLWSIITPFMTLAIGYLFGDFSGKKKSE
jgi:hypothetical protein